MTVDFGTKTVLVTGAAGWLGLRLVDALVKGLPDDNRLRTPQADLTIRCLVLPGQDAGPLRKLSERVEVVTGNLGNQADVAGFCANASGAVVFHCAGVIHPRRVREFYEINVEGTKRLLEAAALARVRRAVVVSSNSPCGCNPSRDHLFDEASPYHPYLNYGRSKMVMEQAVQALQQAGKIETVLIRPPWFYGPYQPPRQTLFFQMIRDGKAPIVGDGNNLRSMCYLDNLCQGLMLAATTEQANGRTYWIADERPYTMNEVIDTVERLLEKEFGVACAHKRMRLPSIASAVAELVDRGLQGLGLYHQKIHVLGEMNKTIACRVDGAKADLGYKPTIALEEGMRRSIRWLIDTSGQNVLVRA